MLRIKGYPTNPPSRPRVAVLGNFDGVHTGHQHLINQARERARLVGGETVVITFTPHPEIVLNPQGNFKNLTSAELRAVLIDKLGVDMLVELPFDHVMASMAPESFIADLLLPHFRPDWIYVGFNFTFGSSGRGNVALLEEWQERFGYRLQVIPAVSIDHMVVSSSSIRTALETGDLDLCRCLLGYWPKLIAPVVHGDGRGTVIGYPTANLQVDRCQALPSPGVYACLAGTSHGYHQAVVNIGSNPTFGPGRPVTVEAHLLDFSGDLYSCPLELEFRRRVRGEIKFSGPQELVLRIARDIEEARKILEATSANGAGWSD